MLQRNNSLSDALALVRLYFPVVLALDGSGLTHWLFARRLHYIARQAFQDKLLLKRVLSPQEQSVAKTSLQELGRALAYPSNLLQRAEPSGWAHVTRHLGCVMPLAERLLQPGQEPAGPVGLRPVAPARAARAATPGAVQSTPNAPALFS